MAAPRLPMCVPPRVRQKYRHSKWPSFASSAQTLSGAVTYNTPFTDRIEPLTVVAPTNSFSPTPPTMTSGCRGPKGTGTAGPLGPAVSLVVHASVRFLTVDWFTWVSEL